MLNDFYKQFKSGTDIRGVASEGVEGQSVNLTDDVVADMADGFVLWLSKKVSKKPSELKISVGRDSRISGQHIKSQPSVLSVAVQKFSAVSLRQLRQCL
ncbi:MAG: hypothetical protein ACLTZ5_09190 [Ruminococcus sp.]